MGKEGKKWRARQKVVEDTLAGARWLARRAFGDYGLLESKKRQNSQIAKILMRSTPVRNIQTDVGIVSEGEEEEDTLGHRERRAYCSRNWLSQIP